MKFKNISEAKNSLIESILLQHKAMIEDNDEVQEKNIKRAFQIDKYIKDNFDLKEMKDLLSHEDEGVKSWVANMLLPIYEEICLKILADVYRQKIPFISISARAMFCKWTKVPFTLADD